MEIFRVTSGNKGLRNSGGKDLSLEKHSHIFCLSEKFHVSWGNKVFTVRPNLKLVQIEKKLIVILKINFKWSNLEGNFPKFEDSP